MKYKVLLRGRRNDLVQRLLHQQIESRADEEPEVTYLGKLPQRLGCCKSGFLQYASYRRIKPRAAVHQLANHLIERAFVRQRALWQSKLFGQLAPHVLAEKNLLSINIDVEQIGPHYGNDPPVFDIGEQFLPVIFVPEDCIQFQTSRLLIHRNSRSLNRLKCSTPRSHTNSAARQRLPERVDVALAV
jgi:hypothetical protein